MAHEVETAAYYQYPAWHQLGVVLQEKMNAAKAIVAGGLDWLVEKRQMYFENREGDGIPFDRQFVLARSTDDSPLGTCSEDYEVDQNIDGFDWMDDLLGEGCTFESVMSLKGGRLVALLAHLPPLTILGEEHTPYLLASLWHDGSHASSIKATAMRVVCKNTWDMAMGGAGSFFSYKHTGDLKAKRDRITKALKLSSDFMDSLAMTASTLADVKISKLDFFSIINEVWPEVKEEDQSSRKDTNRKALLDKFAFFLSSPDLKQFSATGWGLMQAATAFDSHAEPARKTQNWQENRFINLMDGNGIQHSFLQAIRKVCSVNV